MFICTEKKKLGSNIEVSKQIFRDNQIIPNVLDQEI